MEYHTKRCYIYLFKLIKIVFDFISCVVFPINL